jgi:hypothetical protein
VDLSQTKKRSIAVALNPANYGYLPAIVIKELQAGRTVEITGGLFAIITSMDDYHTRKYRLIGKFGEIIGWANSNKKALVATRSPPPWAEAIIHKHIWEAEEMFRWQIPEELR